MDMNQKAKSKVLQQIMDMMDERSLGDLKSKSPKFAKVDIQSDDPELAEELKENMIDGLGDKEDKDDKFPIKSEENLPLGEAPDEEDPDMEKLLEMYHKLK